VNHSDYTDAFACRNAGMPLGGMGAGSLEIRPDGYFHGWYLMNNKPWGSGPETDEMERLGLRFGLRCKLAGQAQAAGFALGEHVGLDPNTDGWFWMSDPYHLPWVRHPEGIDFHASIPIAELGYRLPADAPVGVSLRAWSPFIPHDAEASNTPGAVLEFTIANQTDEECEVSLVGLLKNAVGYDHPELPATATIHGDPPQGFTLGRDGMDDRANTAGTMGLYVTGEGIETSYSLHTRHGRCIWKPLLEEGRLPDQDEAKDVGPFGEVGAETSGGPSGLRRSTLCASTSLAPSQAKTVRFYLTWCFPNFTELPREDNPVNVIGVQYARRFDSATAVARWLHQNHDDLLGRTRAFHDATESTTLPGWLKQAINAAWAVFVRAAWWDYDGRFGVWEGLGCCGMQTVDVGHYASLATLQLFPQLDASQNRLTAANLEPTGKVPHLMPGNFGCSDHKPHKRGRIDLGPQYVLAVWRNALWTGEVEDARELWPVVQRNMELMEEFDTNGDGLPDNQGSDQTYDRFPMYGVSSYVGFLYLASLQAAADLAEWLGHDEQAESYRAKAGQVAPKLDEALWNGEYFNLSRGEEEGENAGCMTDQVNADWFWRRATGDALLDEDKVRSALSAVFEHNRGGVGDEHWLVNCSWPRGDGLVLPMVGSDQVNCPWTGVEYAIASHMVSAGLSDEGLAVARAAFDRYERAGMRFNHIECGQYYYRMLSVWQIAQSAFGLAWDGRANELTVSPPEGDQAFVVATPQGWATADWSEATGELTLTGQAGEMHVRRLHFRGGDAGIDPVTLTPGQTTTLTVT
jgi:uncharacterized protein (DUF608 family)